MFEIPEDTAPEDRKLLEEVMTHPEIFNLSDSGRLSLVDPEAMMTIPEVREALEALKEQGFGITVENSCESGVETAYYPGITRKKERHQHIAIVYFEGDVDTVFYGDDPIKMRESIDRIYNDDFGRGPDTVVMAVRR